MSVPSPVGGVLATAGVGAGQIDQGTTKPQGAVLGVAIVTWSPPSPNNGDAVVDYVVTASPGGATRTLLVDDFPWRAVFSGLTVGTQYTFSIVARNTDGSSDAVVSNPVKPQYALGWLSQVYYTFVAQFAADGQNANIQLGGQFKAENDSPPKIVWQPRTGVISQTGFQIQPQPRQIRTRSLQIPILCWARATASEPPDQMHDDVANYDAAEKLMNNVVASLNKIAFGGDVIRTEQWLPQNEANTTLGAAVVLGVELRFPILDYPQPTVRVADVTPTANVSPVPP